MPFVACAAASTPTAESSAYEDTFRSFTACDAGFFKRLHDHSDVWAKVAPLDTRDGISWIAVQNRNTEEGQKVSFSQPPVIAGVKFLSWVDDASDLDDLGRYYYWGFTVEGKVDEVARKLMPLVFDSRRVRKDGNVFARTEAKIDDSGWFATRSSSGTPSGMRLVERVFLFESGEQPGVTRVSCSLQGGVTGDILKDARPDIDPKDYPAPLSRPSATAFDDTQIPASVIESLDAARAGNPLWMPKFKRLTIYDEGPFTEQSGYGDNGGSRSAARWAVAHERNLQPHLSGSANHAGRHFESQDKNA